MKYVFPVNSVAVVKTAKSFVSHKGDLVSQLAETLGTMVGTIHDIVFDANEEVARLRATITYLEKELILTNKE